MKAFSFMVCTSVQRNTSLLMPSATVPCWNDRHQRDSLLWWRSESVCVEVTVFVEMNRPSCLSTPVKHKHPEYTSLWYKGYESLTITVYKTAWKTFFFFFSCVRSLPCLWYSLPRVLAAEWFWQVPLCQVFGLIHENSSVARKYKSCMSCKCTPAWVIAAGAIPCGGYRWETCAESPLKLYHLSFAISERCILQLTRFGGFLEVCLKTLCICLSVANLKQCECIL